jgi:hypothetical protein
VRRLGPALLALVALYLGGAYLILPRLWRHYEHHPALAQAPKTTLAADGLPGDPLNVALVGTEEEVHRAFSAAGWRAAAALGVRSDLGIAGSVLLDRPDPTAPVSNLFLFGRHQDLAFEDEVGESARHRHHVRFWRADALGLGGRPLWIGAATFDRGVGVDHRTGQITHHIAPDLDAERDGLIDALAHAGRLAEVFDVTGVGPTLAGRNGGGDRYFTDGELAVGVLVAGEHRHPGPPVRLPNPPAIVAKDWLWHQLH